MRKPHFANAIVAAAMLVLAACGGDSTAPASQPFDPAGTNADLGAIDASFQSSPMASYTAASGLIGGTLRGSAAAAAVKAVPPAKLLSGGSAGAASYAAAMARRHAGLARPTLSASAPPIPQQYLGVTFVYDLASEAYVASDLPGAPENGVRFVLYDGDPSTGVPNEPLVEVGHADITAADQNGSSALRIAVSSAEVTYLDYSVTRTVTDSTEAMTVVGFATDGTDRIDFESSTHIATTAVTLSFQLTVPTRDNFRLSVEAQVTDSLVTVDVEARGEHGTVAISGVVTNGAGNLAVQVNAKDFATLNVNPDGEPTFTGTDAATLTDEETGALRRIVELVSGCFVLVAHLGAPVS